MNPDEKRKLATAHASSCLQCAFVVMRYRKELEGACQREAIPDELLSKIRARLCRQGALVLDRIVEATHG